MTSWFRRAVVVLSLACLSTGLFYLAIEKYVKYKIQEKNAAIMQQMSMSSGIAVACDLKAQKADKAGTKYQIKL